MLMALGIALPKTIFAHGWWLTESGEKMSKSKGTVVKPLDMKEVVGVDPLRFFLTRDISLGNDAAFSPDLVVSRVNTDLANNLGNLLARVTNLVDKNFGGKSPALPAAMAGETNELLGKLDGLADRVQRSIEEMAPQEAVVQVMDVLNDANKYIGDRAPWKQVKTDLIAAGETLTACLEVLRVAGILLSPVMPTKMRELLAAVGAQEAPSFAAARKVIGIAPGSTITKGVPLFPRLEWKAEA
jgi:methionyl-tRNA synthetase